MSAKQGSKSGRPLGCVVVAVVLSIPILIVTFTKEPVPDGAGVSVADLRRHFGWRGAVLGLAATLERDFPGDFSGSELGTDEQNSGWIGFRDAVPAAAAPVLAAFGADPRNGRVEIRDHQGFSSAELKQRADAARAAVSALDVVRAGTVRADAGTGVLEVEVNKADGVTLSDDELRRAVLDAIRPRIPLRVEPWAQGARATDAVQPVRIMLGTAEPGSA